MVTHAKTVFEAEARAAKVRALVRQIDRELLLDMPAGELATWLRAHVDDEAFWLSLARAAGLIGKGGRVLVPSDLTRECVALEFDCRAEEEANEDLAIQASGEDPWR